MKAGISNRINEAKALLNDVGEGAKAIEAASKLEGIPAKKALEAQVAKFDEIATTAKSLADSLRVSARQVAEAS